MEVAIIETSGAADSEQQPGTLCGCLKAFGCRDTGKPDGACGCLMIPFAIYFEGAWENALLVVIN